MKTKNFLVYCLLALICISTGQTYSKQEAPYGSWKSALTSELASGSAISFSAVTLFNESVYWLENRPHEGRTTIMRWHATQGEQELLPQEYCVHSRVHEYGGGDMLVTQHVIYFINNDDQQIYSLQKNGTVTKITDRPNARFADGCQSVKNKELFYIMEEHNEHNVTNSIVRINPINGNITPVAFGNDFYSNPRISPDGKSLAYITWNFPNMSWDSTELWVINLENNTKRLVAGTSEESIGEPTWSSDNILYYVSDSTNWWNIYQEKRVEPLWNIDAECTQPQWCLGSSLVCCAKKNIFCSYIDRGINKLAQIDTQAEPKIKPLAIPFTSIDHMCAQNNTIALIGVSPSQPQCIALYNVETEQLTIIKESFNNKLDPAYISTPDSLEFPTVGNRTAHAFFYPPTNPDYAGMSSELPPLLVMSHGGPTAHTSPEFKLNILYWTSRGFAVVDVNYGGSTGYGREYRQRLQKQWGIVDVDDCTAAARYCIEQGLVDKDRIAIMGRSAGGFTTLAVLAFRDLFKVGACYFGVSDLERLALDTHKFESHYLEQLIGPYPEDRATYIERSPVHSINTITCPIIIFQGSLDAIVPPSQSEMIYQGLLDRGIPTAYLLYEGEYHGFGKAENIKRSLEAQLYFFSKVLGFPLSEEIEPVDIKNL